MAKARLNKRWWVGLAALLVVAVTGRLGFWQLDRAAQKQAMFDQMASRATEPEVAWADLDAVRGMGSEDAQNWHDRKARLNGRWLPEHTVFLDNRPMSGRAGFYVLTPLLPATGGEAILVVRGWVPRNVQDRTALPPVDTPDEWVVVTGRLAPPPSKLYEFGGAESGPIRQNIDLGAYAAERSLRLWPLVLVQTAPTNPSDVLARDWPRVNEGLQKHHGYAFQWFGLAALTALLYVWFQIIVPRRARR